MDLPLLVPVPPPPVRPAIPNEAWGAILDAWILLTELRVHDGNKEFGKCASAHSFSLPFLASYFAAHGDARVHGSAHDSRKTKRLRKSVFGLARRYYLDTSSPGDGGLLDWRLLGDFSQCYHSHAAALRELLSEVWNRYSAQVTASVEKGRNEIMQQLQKHNSTAEQQDTIITDLRRLTVLAATLPQVGHVLMTGSDYLDALYDAYKPSSSSLQSALSANAYVGLMSLLKAAKPNLSLLLDHLFTLRVAAGVGGAATKHSKKPGLLSDLVCSTDMLVRIERYLISAPQKRGQDLVSSLRAYQQEMKQFHHRHQRHKKRIDKGKAAVDVHAHKLSLIMQIQDLFPDLGAGYVLRLLDFYNDSVETIMAHLLDDSLSTELKSLDKSEPLPDTALAHDVLEPHHHTPDLPEQPVFTRNIDMTDDPLMQAALSSDPAQSKKLHFGRATSDTTADTLLADRSQHATNKAAILSALATFDSDDDERDDTYDVADVGGTVDATDTDEKRSGRSAEETDIALYRAWKATPALFARDSNTRRSQPRAALKREMGMTDEAIEGWAVMLQRDAKREARLESKIALGAGVAAGGAAAGQPDLASTAYRKPKADLGSDEEEEDGDGDRTAGSARGRGRGRGGGGPNRGGRGGRGGGRGRGANHRRRDQHAKKMARAMPAS
ncbi:hypothetical protein PISL3812_08102 [Talaromyces islandicus]|uniref:CUE domain-containing protein n=1 Tax=Talaromyces islandicus TaxID=28573 RepID=A0A0U1M663_TALIS|nr:hypothetical protein PISL3812_08102 [Talaromyces islandicus]